MDCRTARTFLNEEAALAPDEQQAYQAHLATCAACRDDQQAPLGRALVQATRELALPPPSFTAKLMQRLPSESPFVLAEHASKQQQRRVFVMSAGGVAIACLAVIAGLSLQFVWAGTMLGLIAQVILTVVVATAQPLAAMLASALAVGLLLQLVVRHPSPSRSIAAAALASLLLLSVGAVTVINDDMNVAAVARTNSSAATLFRSLQINQPFTGTVASLSGDIRVDSSVRGDVTSVAGNVELAPSAKVDGNVLAAQLQAEANQIAGAVHQNAGLLAAAEAVTGSRTTTTSTGLARGLGALLGALITLALAALLVLLWPHRVLRISQRLPVEPLSALGLGVMVTVLLMLIALPVLALLAATVVGLLLVPVLLLAIHLPYVQGLAAVGQALGQRLTGAPTVASALWGVAVQLVVVLGLGVFQPLAGLAAFYLLASLGLGANVLERSKS